MNALALRPPFRTSFKQAVRLLWVPGLIALLGSAALAPLVMLISP